MKARTKQSISTRKAILEATLKTITEHTISGTRIKNIAQHAGISQGNVHYHFPTKNDIFLAVLDKLLETHNKEREEKLSDSSLAPVEKLNIFLEQMIMNIRTKRPMMIARYDFWIQASRNSNINTKVKDLYINWYKSIAAVVEEGVSRGDFHPHLAQMAPYLLVSLMEGAALQALINQDAFDLDTYFQAALQVILRSLTDRDYSSSQSSTSDERE